MRAKFVNEEAFINDNIKGSFIEKDVEWIKDIYNWDLIRLDGKNLAVLTWIKTESELTPGLPWLGFHDERKYKYVYVHSDKSVSGDFPPYTAETFKKHGYKII